MAVLSLCLLPSRGGAEPDAICQAEDIFQGPPGIPGERFAGVVALPDVTGDGLHDFAMRTSQSLMLFSGADRSVHCRMDLPTGQSFEDVAPIGDLTGDGVTEIAAGVRGGSAGPGSVLILSGADCSAIRSCPAPPEASVTYSGLGSSVAAAGDLTGDGTPDVLATAAFTSAPTLPPQDGRIVVFSGADCSVWAKSATTGQNPRTLGLPDLTGDGRGEVAVSTTGAVSIFSGEDLSLVRTLTDPDALPEDGFAQTMTLVPDFTGDGVPELAAGEPGGPATNGAFALFSLTDGTLLRRCLDPLGHANDGLGTTLAGVGNAYGDGRIVIVAGVAGRDGSAINTGEVQVYDAATCDLIQRLSDASSSASAGLGKSVAGLGDVNGDGLQDLVTAEVSYDPDHPAQQMGVLFALDPVCIQPPRVIDVLLDIHADTGKGAGLVTWKTTGEAGVSGFNLVNLDPQRGTPIQLNEALIPCAACLPGTTTSYAFVVTKHKSGKSLFVEMVFDSGRVQTFGPAVKR